MSTCQHMNYPFKSVEIKPGQTLVNDLEHIPTNPVIGSIVLDTQNNKMLMWNGTRWLPIDAAAPEEEVLKEWELLTDEKGFLNIRIFVDPDEKRRIIVSDEEGIVVAQNLDNVLQYIKNNTSEKQYLWAEARIFEYFS